MSNIVGNNCNNQNKAIFIAWFTWFVAAIFYLYQYILRVMPSVMLNDIMQQYNIDAGLFGQFSGSYYLGYSLMHIPIGLMLDRFGPRKVMPVCMLLTVIGLLPIIFTNNWVYPIIGRFLIGVGSSAAILGTFKIIRMYFAEQKFSRMLSFAVTIGLIGAIYGGGPLAEMTAAIGYKAVTAVLAIMGIILATITYIVVPDIQVQKTNSVINDIKAVLSNSQVILLCVSAGLLVGPLEGFADVWASEFLKQHYMFDSSIANYLPSFIFIGMCFGAPVLSYIAERSGYYFGTIIGAGVIMFAIFILLILGIFNSVSMSIGFLITGVCCSYQILAIYKASTYVPENLAGITTAVANMIIMFFGYFLHTSIGLIIELCSKNIFVQSISEGIIVIPVTLFWGIVGFCYLAHKENARAKAVI